MDESAAGFAHKQNCPGRDLFCRISGTESWNNILVKHGNILS